MILEYTYNSYGSKHNVHIINVPIKSNQSNLSYI